MKLGDIFTRKRQVKPQDVSDVEAVSKVDSIIGLVRRIVDLHPADPLVHHDGTRALSFLKLLRYSVVDAMSVDAKKLLKTKPPTETATHYHNFSEVISDIDNIVGQLSNQTNDIAHTAPVTVDMLRQLQAALKKQHADQTAFESVDLGHFRI